MPKNKMQPATFTLTQQQVKKLKELSRITGLSRVEIVRRALDAYLDVQFEAERKKQMMREVRNVFNELFTAEQLQEITALAKARGISEIEFLRVSVDNELATLN